MRCTDRKLIPTALASIRPVQCVASPGGGPVTRSMTFWTVAAGSGGLTGLRVLSRSNPSTPSRHEPLLPSPHHRLRFARSAHDLGGAAAVGGGEDDLGAPHMLETIASSRRRSARVTLTTIPALMPRA